MATWLFLYKKKKVSSKKKKKGKIKNNFYIFFFFPSTRAVYQKEKKKNRFFLRKKTYIVLPSMALLFYNKNLVFDSFWFFLFVTKLSWDESESCFLKYWTKALFFIFPSSLITLQIWSEPNGRQSSKSWWWSMDWGKFLISSRGPSGCCESFKDNLKMTWFAKT